jgi:hypothetical protein
MLAPEQGCAKNRLLTSNKKGEIGEDMVRPALGWYCLIPQVSRVLALDKDKQRCEDIDHVHVDNHKPQQGHHPPLHHNAQEGQGEGCFAQSTRHDGQGLTNVA